MVGYTEVMLVVYFFLSRVLAPLYRVLNITFGAVPRSNQVRGRVSHGELGDGRHLT